MRGYDFALSQSMRAFCSATISGSGLRAARPATYSQLLHSRPTVPVFAVWCTEPPAHHYVQQGDAPNHWSCLYRAIDLCILRCTHTNSLNTNRHTLPQDQRSLFRRALDQWSNRPHCAQCPFSNVHCSNAPKICFANFSGCPDLNWGHPAPKAGALPGCATPRNSHKTKSATLRSRSEW